MQVDQIQEAIRAENLDGWLFFDHHRRDPVAYRILGIPAQTSATRRWYYFIPASGEPKKLVHNIESGSLDDLPGVKQSYSSWMDQHQKLEQLVLGSRRIAMQYSPKCAVPSISFIDAGTMELVISTGVSVFSSANLVQQFDSILSAAQFELHQEAGKLLDQIRQEAFQLAKQKTRAALPFDEYELQQFMCTRMAQLNLVNDHGPIVAVNANASDPHYEPSRHRRSPIKTGDLLLIDSWAKLKAPGAVFYDITWTGYCGDAVPSDVQTVFEIVRNARKAASNFVIKSIGERRMIAGFEVDDVARNYITNAGFGNYFTHRTGHSIGEEVHGTGANMDNLESHDDRKIVSDTCFSIEPGIYLPHFGIRSEVNVYVSKDGASVTGEEQERLVIV